MASFLIFRCSQRLYRGYENLDSGSCWNHSVAFTTTDDGTGEMAERLKKLVALTEDKGLSSNPSTAVVAHVSL